MTTLIVAMTVGALVCFGIAAVISAILREDRK